jgi:hypothetical protein
MGYADIALMVSIAAGAVYLLYRSIWKKKGYCHGCGSAGSCGQDPRGSHPIIAAGDSKTAADR